MSKQLYSDEGYITGNEKNYEILELGKEDSDEWDVDTDTDQNGRKYEDENPNGKKNPNQPPVRNQMVSHVNTAGLHMVNIDKYSGIDSNLPVYF